MDPGRAPLLVFLAHPLNEITQAGGTAERRASEAMLKKKAKRCPFRKSYPNILMMQSGQDWDGDNDTGPLDCSMQGRIVL